MPFFLSNVQQKWDWIEEVISLRHQTVASGADPQKVINSEANPFWNDNLSYVTLLWANSLADILVLALACCLFIGLLKRTFYGGF